MIDFAQHTTITARIGMRDTLVAKFDEAAELQRDNPACLLTLVGIAPDDGVTVYLTEVWTSQEAQIVATQSPQVARWAQGMGELVAVPPTSTRFAVVAGSARAR